MNRIKVPGSGSWRHTVGWDEGLLIPQTTTSLHVLRSMHVTFLLLLLRVSRRLHISRDFSWFSFFMAFVYIETEGNNHKITAGVWNTRQISSAPKYYIGSLWVGRKDTYRNSTGFHARFHLLPLQHVSRTHKFAHKSNNWWSFQTVRGEALEPANLFLE